mgnify:CR=1 FL=1
MHHHSSFPPITWLWWYLNDIDGLTIDSLKTYLTAEIMIAGHTDRHSQTHRQTMLLPLFFVITTIIAIIIVIMIIIVIAAYSPDMEAS